MSAAQVRLRALNVARATIFHRRLRLSALQTNANCSRDAKLPVQEHHAHFVNQDTLYHTMDVLNARRKIA